MTDSYDVGYLDGEVVGYERGLSDGLNYDGYGPPTREDDAWFQEWVVSRGYPKLRREPKQMDGQLRIPASLDPSDDCDYEPHHAGDENL